MHNQLVAVRNTEALTASLLSAPSETLVEAMDPRKTEIRLETAVATEALAEAGQNDNFRAGMFDLLRRAQTESPDPVRFKEEVRWPLVASLLRDVHSHPVRLSSGLIFEVGADSRIEKALLLSDQVYPDHVWEPQTTKLLTALASGASHIVVGGAYIGDHVLPMAHSAPESTIHAFEPMEHSFLRLLRNIAINDIHNVIAHQAGLWDSSDVTLELEGPVALATSVQYDASDSKRSIGAMVRAISLSDYLEAEKVAAVDLIMLDTEGGEERALLGARSVLAQPVSSAPNLVFEVHRDYVDWSIGLAKTPIVQLLVNYGYRLFAIRDIHSNYAMDGQPIEVVPVETVYTDGPSHGFNMLAIKDYQVISRLGLRIVEGVSPKLIPEKDPALHHPSGGFGNGG